MKDVMTNLPVRRNEVTCVDHDFTEGVLDKECRAGQGMSGK